jgi:hypothetical protein
MNECLCATEGTMRWIFVIMRYSSLPWRCCLGCLEQQPPCDVEQLPKVTNVHVQMEYSPTANDRVTFILRILFSVVYLGLGRVG